MVPFENSDAAALKRDSGSGFAAKPESLDRRSMQHRQPVEDHGVLEVCEWDDQTLVDPLATPSENRFRAAQDRDSLRLAPSNALLYEANGLP
jgi:hypothetical protein